MAERVKVNIFEDTKEALTDAAAYERGEGVNLRVTRIPRDRRTFRPRKSGGSASR